MKLTLKEKKRLKDKYGEWALITGASSGIGLELAERLAESGLNLIINSRHLNKLQEIEKSFKAKYQIEIQVIEADIAKESDIEKIIQSTQNLNVGLLVVCAGYGTSGLFIESKLHTEINMLRVNCEAVLSITHYYSKLFAQQKRGGIILMSSIVAFQGVPFSANYSATKAYVQSLAEALAFELGPYGVDILAAVPGPVDSGFGERANMKMNMALKPFQIGIPILKALGRKKSVLPGFLSKFLANSIRTVPRWGKVRIMAAIMGGFTKHQRAPYISN
jgi:short-subunit dehydrogenase